MVDLNKIRFTTTPEGIRCAGEIRAHGCDLIYIHRYDVGCILGLQRSDNMKIEWKRLLDAYNQVSSIVEDPGFSTSENKSSSKSIPSQYELQHFLNILERKLYIRWQSH